MPKTMMVAMVELRDEAGNKRTVNVIADQTTKELIHDLKAVAEKATTDISTDAAEVKHIAEEVSESYENIFDRLSTVESIAKGRSAGYVFDTKADMDTALQQEAFVSKLIKGDNLYIRDLNAPDYWWDGEQAYELETQKVDLSEYYTKEEIELELKPLEQLLPAGTPEVGQVLKVLSVNDDGTFVCTWDDAGLVKDVTVNGESVLSEDGVADIPLAGQNKLGLTKVNSVGGGGLSIDSKGTLQISKATNEQIAAKTNTYQPIVPSSLPYAVKTTMSAPISATDPAWTDEEKARAQERLGTERAYFEQEENGYLRLKGVGRDIDAQLLNKKIDKPEEVPVIGMVLKVKFVNADGSFVCEWGESSGNVNDVRVDGVSVLDDDKNANFESSDVEALDASHFVKDTDIATETKAGLLLNNSYNVGLKIEPGGALAGQLCIKEPVDSMVKERLSNGWGKAYVAITPSKVDNYILAHLTDGLFRAYTPEEQAAAQIRLGILSSEGVGF